ncbi:hypothetical protein ABGB18_36955 [Nonomuraea sp. B12E4]|uniref:hypothetical protein n=1 Tax=Nonomuraea sp. B12E4 TaxID=3153564 RepID=UPI00325C7B60
MGIMLPPEYDATLEMAGLWWPNVDEDEVNLDGDAADIVQRGTTLAAAEVDSTVGAASAVYQGDSSTEMQRSTDHNSARMAQASHAMRLAPPLLHGMGTVVTGTKVVVGTIAAIGTARLLQAALSGPAAGPRTMATLLAIRRAGVKAFRQAAEGSGRHLARGVEHRITRPIRELLESRSRFGPPGSPAFAGVPSSGGTRLAGVRNPIERPQVMEMRGGRGGRGGGRGRTEADANLTDEELEALEAKEQGLPYDRSLFNRAAGKVRKAEKFSGDRNKQKRGRKG